MNKQLYELTKSAEEDLEAILLYSLERHGRKQAKKYSSSLLACLDSLAQGKGHIRQLLDIDEDMSYLRCEHHYIFGIQNPKSMIIVAILHERMDIINRIANRLR